MEKNNIQKILNYYLEYEIYNIANSSQIKTNSSNCYIIKGEINSKQVIEELNKLKQNNIISVTEKFIGKKAKNKETIIQQVIQELDCLNSEQANQIQVVSRIKKLIIEKIKNIDTKIIENFANQICDIKATNEFWMYSHNISFTSKNNKGSKKQPVFIFKCEYEDGRIKIIDANVNSATINTILTIILDKEMADISIEYEEAISNYSKEIKSSIDSGDIEHIIDLFYAKMSEYVESCLTRENIKNVSQKNSHYNINEEYIIALDEITDGAIKNIKEDIELLKKIIECNSYIPNLLNKYLNGSVNKKNINDSKYEKTHRGNYKSKYGVGQGQYKIVNSINDNDLIAVEGPPGTGKTSLLKEIIANKIVERANLIVDNWNQNFTPANYFGNTYYKIDWYNKNTETIKSIVVSSKNGEAIENVGKEVNKDIEYMMPISKKYKRTHRLKNGTKFKEIAQYKGLICLPLGKQDNVQDFWDFLYQIFLPILENFQDKDNAEILIEKVKEEYQKKVKEVKEYENFLLKLSQIKNSKYYFYGIETEKEKLTHIENKFKKDKDYNENRIKNIKIEAIDVTEELNEKEKELNSNKENIGKIENKIKESQQKIVEYKTNIKSLEENKINFEKISKNLFTKLINHKIYRANKNVDFNKEIIETQVANDTENRQIEQYIKEKSVLEKENHRLSKQYENIRNKQQNLKTEYKEVKIRLKEINLIEEFNEKNKEKYWNYSSMAEIYCKSYLNELNQELFQLALKLNEAYIIKNRKEIAENLRLFLPEEQPSYICQKFYDSTDIYNEKKQEGIRNLWNTLFLCFPVITTTLDSFCKRCFHLIPEYIDLELIDESGQILPHNLVSALYRAKKAVIVGDVNQIEPIYNNVNKDFYQNQKEIGKKFEDIKIEENSIQTLANKHTDILNNGENIILNDHYRCEKNIINFSNQNVYENKLNIHVKDNHDKPFFNNMIALDIRGRRTKKNSQNGSKNENKIEVEACIQTIKYIKEQDKENPSIAIVTPFIEQKSLLESRLKREELSEEIKVGTVHAFQGQEKDYIIFTPTLDAIEPKWAVKFIGNKCNMLNVAVTRAKKQFIYIGNLDVAEQTGNYIAKLIKYIKENGLIYSLYDIDNSALNKNFSERILKILQPELELENDNIGLYIQQKFENGIVLDAKQHYDLMMYTLKNTKKEIFIMSPWIMENVINQEFLNEIKRLKEMNCKVKIVFGYKRGNRKANMPDDIVKELVKTNSLGFAKEESVRKIVNELYNLLGKENFIYAPPTHAKAIIVDEKYMFMGSHNWLSNAGKMEEKNRAKEGTVITTSKDAIIYTKEKLFIKI